MNVFIAWESKMDNTHSLIHSCLSCRVAGGASMSVTRITQQEHIHTNINNMGIQFLVHLTCMSSDRR